MQGSSALCYSQQGHHALQPCTLHPASQAKHVVVVTDESEQEIRGILLNLLPVYVL